MSLAKKITRVDIKVKKTADEIKMSAVWPIKITRPLSPVMKGNKSDSKVNTIFSPIEKKAPLSGFVLFLLID